MLEVTVNINRSHGVADVQAVRRRPLGTPELNQMCYYDVYILSTGIDAPLGKVTFPYGDGVGLAIELLNFYKDYMARQGLS